MGPDDPELLKVSDRIADLRLLQHVIFSRILSEHQFVREICPAQNTDDLRRCHTAVIFDRIDDCLRDERAVARARLQMLFPLFFLAGGSFPRCAVSVRHDLFICFPDGDLLRFFPSLKAERNGEFSGPAGIPYRSLPPAVDQICLDLPLDRAVFPRIHKLFIKCVRLGK